MSASIPQTVIYKTVRGNADEKIEIPLDVYLPSRHVAATTNFSAAPVVIPLIWIHTGGFLQGTRKFAPGHLLRSVDKYNYAVIAPDFRLAPQVNLDTILEDIHDSIHFVLSGKLNKELSTTTTTKIDTKNYILAGSSAGGWSSLLLGLNLIPNLSVPTPSALISIYPITTVNRSIAPYFYTPLKPLPWPYSANAKVGEIAPREPLLDHLDKGGKVRTEAAPTKEPARATLYNFSRQEAIYPSLILAQEQDSEKFCVPSQIKRQLSDSSKQVPNLIFIAYGDADVMVETSQSNLVIDALTQSKVNVKTHIEPGKSHVWDILEPDAEIPNLWESVQSVLER